MRAFHLLKYNNHNKYYYHFLRRKMSKEKQYIPTSNTFTSRYNGPSPEIMTPQQTALRNSILESRPRTGLSGPFGPWLAVPSIAGPSQELGRIVRYGTSLSMRESELVILLTGAKFKSEAEFDIHVGEAMRAGIGLDVINKIPRGSLISQKGSKEGIDNVEFSLENVKEYMIPLLKKEIDNEGKGDLQRDIPIVLFTAELLETNTVSDETYATTKQMLGGDDSVLVEIIAIVGYYAYVAYTLNVFRIPSSSSS
mmetsp:Transcript_1509/g.2058  ORF Transcript_1509/g.2058 Transcript_1509/m.2058 type:complete len:253 (-) Transcript_1509:98-856(-)